MTRVDRLLVILLAIFLLTAIFVFRESLFNFFVWVILFSNRKPGL